jgi:hypothetical protein
MAQRTENFPKTSFNFKIFSHGKFVSPNHILQTFLAAENFPDWKWAFRTLEKITILVLNYLSDFSG